MSQFTPAEISDGIHVINGNKYMGDGRGGFQPLELIKAQDKLEDETVRKIAGYTVALHEQMARYKQHTQNDIEQLVALLMQEYGTRPGGAKGNTTFMTVDGLFMIKLQVADQIVFGPSIMQAKSHFDACLNEWAADAHPTLRGIVTDAFQTDKAGNISRARIFVLLRQEADDARWQEGQRAIRDAIRPVGTKEYIRCYQRPSHDAAWEYIALDLSKV